MVKDPSQPRGPCMTCVRSQTRGGKRKMTGVPGTEGEGRVGLGGGGGGGGEGTLLLVGSRAVDLLCFHPLHSQHTKGGSIVAQGKHQ